MNRQSRGKTTLSHLAMCSAFGAYFAIVLGISHMIAEGVRGGAGESQLAKELLLVVFAPVGGLVGFIGGFVATPLIRMQGTTRAVKFLALTGTAIPICAVVLVYTENWLHRVFPDYGILGIYVTYFLIQAMVFIETCHYLNRTAPAVPDLCACGYNLTGNVSGVCPECGIKLPEH